MVSANLRQGFSDLSYISCEHWHLADVGLRLAVLFSKQVFMLIKVMK